MPDFITVNCRHQHKHRGHQSKTINPECIESITDLPGDVDHCEVVLSSGAIYHVEGAADALLKRIKGGW